MAVAQYVAKQSPETLRRWAKENRQMATSLPQQGISNTNKADLLRWAEELEKLAKGNKH